MDPRQKLYKDITEALHDKVPEVSHIALWNQDVEYTEVDIPWPRPAVFVEFDTIEWERIKPSTSAKCMRGKGKLRLHVVVDWNEDEEAYNEAYGIIEKIWMALDALPHDKGMVVDVESGAAAYVINAPTATATNHSHLSLLENVEEFQVVYMRMW